MGFLIAFLLALVGGLLGVALGMAIALGFATVTRMSNFEGAAGYFVVYLGGGAGALIGFVAAGLVALRMLAPEFGLSARLGVVAGFLGVFWLLVAALVTGLSLLHARTGGAPPQLLFEIRGDRIADARIDLIEGAAPGRELLVTERATDRLVGVGDLRAPASRRRLVLSAPGAEDRVFDVSVGRRGRHDDGFGAWRDPIAGAGAALRYRVRDPRVEFARPIADFELVLPPGAAPPDLAQCTVKTRFRDTDQSGVLSSRTADGVIVGVAQFSGDTASRLTITCPGIPTLGFELAAPRTAPWPLALVQGRRALDFGPWLESADGARLRYALR